MKAYVLNAVNDLRYEDIDEPACPDGWALVQVKASGICSSDIPRIFTKGTYHFPTIPGHEFSGVVKQVGNEKDMHWLNKKVGVFPLIPCRECEQCKAGHYEMCANYDYVGSRRDGGFAETVAVPVWNLIELAQDIPFEIAAMLEPLSVALHAMKQANIKEGDTVGIIGTGMIGFAAAQWAKCLGAKAVTIIGRSEAKRSLADNIGADYTTIESLDKEFDVVLEAVGSNAAISTAISAVCPGGNLVLMGNPEGNIQLDQNTYWRILRKQLHVVGTWNSAYESGEKCDWSEAVAAIGSKKVQMQPLISHLLQQTELKSGLDLMKNHKEPYCKVVVLWNQEKQ